MDRSYEAIWRNAAQDLEHRLSPDLFERWIRGIRAVEGERGELVLEVANDFYVCWLEENYLPLIRDAVTAAAGQPLTLRLAVAPKPAPAAKQADLFPSPAQPERPAPPTARARIGSPLNPKYTFASFVIGPTNNLAHAAAIAVAQAPARAYNPLLIYGGVGLGKTHLMQAIGNHVAAVNRSAKVCFLSADAFFNEYIQAIQEKRTVEFRRRYRSVDVLLIDDIHHLVSKEGTQEEFFHTFNNLHNEHKQIVLTCDRPVSELKGLEPRLASRFEWGVTVQLEAPDTETRIAILRKKAEEFNVQVPDELIFYLAEHIRSNIRRLEGALNRVAMVVALERQPLTTSRLESLLQDTLDRQAAGAPSLEAIQKAVAEHFDLRLGDMTSKRRPQSITLPRQVAMFLCRSLTTHSLPEIGESFSRNHATILHACRAIHARMRQDPGLRQAVTTLRARLGAD